MEISPCDLGKIYDGRISKGSVLIFQCCTTYLIRRCRRSPLTVSACHIQNQILVAQPSQVLPRCIIQLVQVSLPETPSTTPAARWQLRSLPRSWKHLRRLIPACRPCILSRAAFAISTDLYIPDTRVLPKTLLLSSTSAAYLSASASSSAVYIYNLCVHSLTDTVIINLWDLSKLCIYCCIIHACAKDQLHIWSCLQMFFHV